MASRKSLSSASFGEVMGCTIWLVRASKDRMTSMLLSILWNATGAGGGVAQEVRKNGKAVRAKSRFLIMRFMSSYNAENNFLEFEEIALSSVPIFDWPDETEPELGKYNNENPTSKIFVASRHHN